MSESEPLDNQYGPSPKDKPPVWIFRIDVHAAIKWIRKMFSKRKKRGEK